MKLASFDIFDTTLIRKCGKPENVFYILAHKLYPSDRAKREDFLLWRKGAESEARRQAPGKDVTIDDIYRSEKLKGFDEYSKKKLIEAEKDVEAEQLIVNPAIRDVINKKREEGYTICFISDMYLPSTTLKEVLAREGCIKEDEQVYVSCEWNARKSNGTLYKRLKEKLQPEKWEHYGDHPISDIKVARKNGVKATTVDTAFNSAEENTILPPNKRNSYDSSILAGLSRAARIHHGNDAYTNIAADFVAPAYIPYVHFIIEEARERGIKSLYFLSRDSYILQEIAEQLPHDGIELRYLFVSRKALLLPYLQNATAEKFLAVQNKGTIKGKNVEDLSLSLGTSVEELKEKFGIGFNFVRITTKKQEEVFLQTIFGTESKYLPTLNKRAAEKRELLNDYFKQEKVFGDNATAMVDVGWLGTTRLMINSILKEEGYPETLFFYYGVRNDVLGSQYGRYITFHNPATSNTELTFLVEDYLSATPYKTTTGYSRGGDNITAQLAGEKEYNRIIISNRKISQWIANEMEKFPYDLHKFLQTWEEIALDAALRNIQKFNLSPLVECKISRKLNFWEFIDVVLLGGHKTWYDQASIAMSVPKRGYPILWSIAKKSGKIRHHLAIRFKR